MSESDKEKKKLKGVKNRKLSGFKYLKRIWVLGKIKNKKLDKLKKISTFAVPTKTGKQNLTDVRN